MKVTIDELLSFPEVSCVDRPPRPNYFRPGELRVSLSEVDTGTPPDPGDPAIIVLDSGILSGHPLLKNGVGDAISLFPEYDGTDDVGHGTMVAGVALYGDIKECADMRCFHRYTRLTGAALPCLYPLPIFKEDDPPATPPVEFIEGSITDLPMETFHRRGRHFLPCSHLLPHPVHERSPPLKDDRDARRRRDRPGAGHSLPLKKSSPHTVAYLAPPPSQAARPPARWMTSSGGLIVSRSRCRPTITSKTAKQVLAAGVACPDRKAPGGVGGEDVHGRALQGGYACRGVPGCRHRQPEPPSHPSPETTLSDPPETTISAGKTV